MKVPVPGKAVTTKKPPTLKPPFGKSVPKPIGLTPEQKDSAARAASAAWMKNNAAVAAKNRTTNATKIAAAAKSAKNFIVTRGDSSIKTPAAVARDKQAAQAKSNAAAAARAYAATHAKPVVAKPVVAKPVAAKFVPKPNNVRQFPAPMTNRTIPKTPTKVVVKPIVKSITPTIKPVPARTGVTTGTPSTSAKPGTPATSAVRPVTAPTVSAPAPAAAPIVLGNKGNEALKTLRDMADQYFGGSYDSNILNKWAADVEKGGHNIDYYKQAVSAGNATPDEIAKRAGLTVGSEIDPQVAEIDKQLKENTTTGASDISAIQRAYDLVKQGSSDNATATDTKFKTATDAVGSNYGKLQDTISTNYKTATDATNTELARLGISNPDATSRLTADQQWLKNLAETDKTVQTSSMANQATSMRALNDRLTAGITADSTQRQQDRKKQIDSLMQTLTSAKGTLTASRKSKVYNLIQSLNDSANQTAAERQQQDTLNRLAEDKLGLARDTLVNDKVRTNNELTIAQERSKSDAAAIAATNARSAADRTSREKIAADSLAFAMTKAIKDAEKSAQSSPKNYANREGAQRFLEDSTPGVAKDVNQRVVRNVGTSLINKYFSGGNVNNYTRDLANIRKDKNYRELPPQAQSVIQSALGHAYGK